MESIPGIINTRCGYANGSSKKDADYKTVCTGKTGFRETVRVDYDIERISLEKIIFAFFHVIDPTCQNAQGNDKGTQYQTGIYYIDENSKMIIERIIDIEKKRYKTFNVEIKPLESFFDAEEYHQK
ncbi:MAG: peptide-methionine (S)-S-oxide reductase MsrA, partial [Candidatus Methanomethylophilaceae archaeon]|nr:peptide-methionine (S)-S-oxide reductase MsrA [Candidatus Methanomethylophilaceae archaeon]